MNERLHQSRSLRLPSGEVIDLVGNDYSCPGCHYVDYRPIVVIARFSGFSVVVCAHCGLQHLSPLPNREALEMLYNTSYYKDYREQHGYLDYFGDADVVAHTYEVRFKRALKHIPDLPRIKRVHEIGCALGFGLERLREKYAFDLSGSDISHQAVTATNTLGIPGILADRTGRCDLPPESVDLLFYFDVIEHLTDLPLFIAWQQEIIVKGGYILLTTPVMDGILNRLLGRHSPSFKVPQHVVYFTDETVRNCFNPWAQLIASFYDYQYVNMTRLVNRILHVFTSSWVHLERFSKTAITVPNGMKLYLFKKK